MLTSLSPQNVTKSLGSVVKYRDLRDFLAQLERMGDLKRIAAPVSTRLEMTEISAVSYTHLTLPTSDLV